MYDILLTELDRQKPPLDVIVVGLGFMGSGFISSVAHLRGMRVPLVITRRPAQAKDQLEKKGCRALIESHPDRIHDAAKRGYICVSDDTSLINTYDNKVVLDVTGTVAYSTEIALKTLSAKKHLVTMNPELQATVGSELLNLADKQGVLITDVMGDQPGSLSNLIAHARLQGFTVRLAGNMKRYLDRHATQEKMQPWADDKGLGVRQTVSFTDGTKQSIEMTLVANYFGMAVLQFGMKGPHVDIVQEALTAFPWSEIPPEGAADYVIGKTLFPGVFIVAEHDSHQKVYLRYLGLGEGPRYVLFEPYHLCHLEVAASIAKVLLHKQVTINNGARVRAKTIAVAKFDLQQGQVLDGIGGDTVYGKIDRIESSRDYLPIGFAEGAILKRKLHQDQPIELADVIIPENAATKLAGLITIPSHDTLPYAGLQLQGLFNITAR